MCRTRWWKSGPLSRGIITSHTIAEALASDHRLERLDRFLRHADFVVGAQDARVRRPKRRVVFDDEHARTAVVRSHGTCASSIRFENKVQSM
jgi:hypothetical protein